MSAASPDARLDTIEYYNHNAARYWARTRRSFDLDALKLFASKLPSGARVLDAGCGSGRDLTYFSAQGFAAEGFDSSGKMVELAQSESGSTVWKGDFMMLSLPKESFDGIWAHRSLIHLPPVGCQRALASFFMALKPQGHLFVSIEEGQGERTDRVDDENGPPRTFYLYSKDDFASLIKQSGFQILSHGQDLKRPERIAFLARRL